MIVTNHNHIQARIEAPDNSVAIAAEAEHIDGCIGEAMLALHEAKTAAQNERSTEAKAHIQRALWSLQEAME